MRAKVIAIAAALTTAVALSAAALASPLSTAKVPQATAASSLPVEQVDHHFNHRRFDHHPWRRYDRYDDRPRRMSRCALWREECADRWGWGGWRFKRCMIRHGCW